jgi:hypothetical protein
MTGPDVEQSRPFVNAEIERLMEVLDTLDPDPDLEATGDEEPWLGAPDARTGSWSGLFTTGNEDREDDDSDLTPAARMKAHSVMMRVLDMLSSRCSQFSLSLGQEYRTFVPPLTRTCNLSAPRVAARLRYKFMH